MSKLIDIEACKEFLQETLHRIDKGSLVDIARDLELKSIFFINTLGPEKIGVLSEETLSRLFSKIFLIKRKRRKLFAAYSFDQYKSGIKHLLYGEVTVGERFQQFHYEFKDLPQQWTIDMAGELLHFSHPEKYWLWTRWLWDPNANTGALPLLCNEDYQLAGNTEEDRYMNVGKTIAYIHAMAESVEFQFINRSLFGTDVFLSCVYVIYAYTVLKIKMTDEFNKVMPGLAEFSRRILGIYDSKQVTVV